MKNFLKTFFNLPNQYLIDIFYSFYPSFFKKIKKILKAYRNLYTFPYFCYLYFCTYKFER